MHIDDIKLDPEFQALFADTRLSGSDREHLRNKLVTEGFHDPLVLWDGVLLDGYTRLELCREDGIEPATRNVELRDRDHAIEWIRIHQHSRRNLDAKARALNIAEVYEARKRRNGARGPEKPGTEYQAFSDTRDEVAAEFNVSPSTVKQSVEYKRGLDKIEAEGGAEAREEAQQKLSMRQVRERGTKPKPTSKQEDVTLEIPRATVTADAKHQEALAQVISIGEALEPSERKMFSRGLIVLARKWGTSRK